MPFLLSCPSLKKSNLVQNEQMKNISLILVLFLSVNLFALPIKVPRNVFLVETGIYDKGMLAFGYTLNFYQTKSVFFAIELSFGFSTRDSFYPRYYVMAPSINFGNEKNFFTLGVQNKFMNEVSYFVVDDAWGFPFFDAIDYKGYGLTPFVGYNYFGKKGFNFKVRFGLTQIFGNYTSGNMYLTNPRRRYLLATLGVSFGIFKKQH